MVRTEIGLGNEEASPIMARLGDRITDKKLETFVYCNDIEKAKNRVKKNFQFKILGTDHVTALKQQILRER